MSETMSFGGTPKSCREMVCGVKREVSLRRWTARTEQELTRDEVITSMSVPTRSGVKQAINFLFLRKEEAAELTVNSPYRFRPSSRSTLLRLSPILAIIVLGPSTACLDLQEFLIHRMPQQCPQSQPNLTEAIDGVLVSHRGDDWREEDAEDVKVG